MTNPDEETNPPTTLLGTAPAVGVAATMAAPLLSGVAKGSELVSGESGTVPDEDCSKEYAPVVQLAEVETKTGEEDEDVLFKIRAKLFRFSKELGEWKERGTGDVRILKHKENQKIRLLMRREKTLKICLNHYVRADVQLKENVGSDRSWVWHGVDYADGEADLSHLAIRFRDTDSAMLFKNSYDEAREHMRKLLEASEQDDKPADNSAESKDESGDDADGDDADDEDEKAEEKDA